MDMLFTSAGGKNFAAGQAAHCGMLRNCWVFDPGGFTEMFVYTRVGKS